MVECTREQRRVAVSVACGPHPVEAVVADVVVVNVVAVVDLVVVVVLTLTDSHSVCLLYTSPSPRDRG